MGLLNARNLRKAKSLLEQNRHKVGEVVGKATEQIDKVSKGKTSAVSAKVEEAARKYSAGGVTHHGAHPAAGGHVDAPTGAPPPADAPIATDATPATDDDAEPVDDAELQRRQAEANIAAANALKAAADAAASVFNQAAHAADGAPGDDGDSRAT